MKKESVYFQFNIEASSQKVIKELYSITAQETPTLGIWLGQQFQLPLRESGFVFTTNMLYWNFPRTITNEENFVGTSNPNNCFINKTPENFKLVYTKTEETNKLLVLKYAENTYTFKFPSEFSSDTLTQIESIFRNYFTNSLNPEMYQNIDSSYTLKLTGLVITDYFHNLISKLKNRPHPAPKEKQTSKTKQKTSAKKSVSKSESIETHSAEQTPHPTLTKIGNFLRHALDLLADLLLPILIYHISLHQITEEPFKFSFIVFLAYIAIKVIVLFTLPKANKIASILQILLIASLALVPNIFEKENINQSLRIICPLLFLLSIIQIFILQFSMSFSYKAIKRKSIIFIILFIFVYPIIFIGSSPYKNKIVDTITPVAKYLLYEKEF